MAWEWRTGKKLVRFGQQINMCIGVQIMQEDRIISVTIGLFFLRPIDPGLDSKLDPLQMAPFGVFCNWCMNTNVSYGSLFTPQCFLYWEAGDAKPVSS